MCGNGSSTALPQQQKYVCLPRPTACASHGPPALLHQVPLKWAASNLQPSSTAYQDAFGALGESSQGIGHGGNLQMDKVGSTDG
jgi:hypothetical protein